LVIGFFIWRSRKPTIPTDETPATKVTTTDETLATEVTTTDVERLEQFRNDIFEAYGTIEAEKYYFEYIPVGLVKEKLSKKYTPEQFDQLLAKARLKYHDNIWIDRDAKDQPVFIKMVR